MKTIIFLNKEWFTSEDKVILSNEYFSNIDTRNNT